MRDALSLIGLSVVLLVFGLVLKDGWWWLHEALRRPESDCEERRRRLNTIVKGREP